jgi:hypothetical protein
MHTTICVSEIDLAAEDLIEKLLQVFRLRFQTKEFPPWLCQDCEGIILLHRDVGFACVGLLRQCLMHAVVNVQDDCD